LKDCLDALKSSREREGAVIDTNPAIGHLDFIRAFESEGRTFQGKFNVRGGRTDPRQSASISAHGGNAGMDGIVHEAVEFVTVPQSPAES
jgi:hypothetical protein